jgi:hypothetical protein
MARDLHSFLVRTRAATRAFTRQRTTHRAHAPLSYQIPWPIPIFFLRKRARAFFFAFISKTS